MKGATMKKRNTKKPKNYLSGITELDRALRGQKRKENAFDMFDQIFKEGKKQQKGGKE